MAEQIVELAPGESKQVSFEAIPHEAKVYQVSVDGLIGSFKAIGVAKFYVPSEMTKKLTDGTILDMYWNCEVWCSITNKGDAPGTYNIHVWDSVANLDRTFSLTLGPGESYTWYHSQWVDFRRISTYIIHLQGNWEMDSYSVATFP